MNQTIRVFLAGDSTVQTYDDPKVPQAGWGQYIGESFQDCVHFCNRSKAARSSKTFVEEGRLAAILREIGPGDWLLVQMGHNDANREKPERYTEPEAEFPRYLKMYLNGAREKKANPLLITPVARLHCENGVFMNDFEEYCSSMKRLGREENVPVVDLMSLSLARLEKLGPEAAREWYMVSVNGTDMTHFSQKGAREVAAVLAEGIRRSGISLAQYLK
jgi:lysophospholipase L1-like esterase